MTSCWRHVWAYTPPRIRLIPAVRNEGLEYALPVAIGDNVWIGAHAVINPGVTIGSNTVIGSGSVVMRDIPEGVVAAGNPCRVLREVTEEDARYWAQRKRNTSPRFATKRRRSLRSFLFDLHAWGGIVL